MRPISQQVASLLQGACLTAMVASSAVHAQQKIIGFNQTARDLENRLTIVGVNSDHDQTQKQTQAEVAKFLAAVQPRKDMYPDFDKVVLHGTAPVTPKMLALMSESPYAADIAYYLGQHPEQSKAIATTSPQQAQSAIKQIEAAAAATNPIHK